MGQEIIGAEAVGATSDAKRTAAIVDPGGNLHVRAAQDAATGPAAESVGDVYSRAILEELRGIRVLLAIQLGLPAIFPPLPDVRTNV